MVGAMRCGDCEHYLNSLDTGPLRRCDATGKKVWPGGEVDECTSLAVETPNGRLCC